MGVCLSRCGDAQQKAGVVAATISHQNSLELNASDLYDSNHSLKRFLHLYEIAEAKKSLSSPRASLGESLMIPHSSELFSLPDSDIERSSCCRSPSPARTSRASVSSRATTSPKSTRNSFSVWGGRFSTDRTISVGCRKKIRPARSSKSLTGDQDLAAHQRLVEAIARLERLNGGKNLELRGSSFCSSDLEKKTHVLAKSRSGELKRERAYSTSGGHHGRHGRHGRHYQPYQPSLPLFGSATCPKSNDPQPHACEDQSDTSHCCSRTHDLRSTKRTSYIADAASMLPPESFSQPKTMGNLVSLAAPIIKEMPLEKSVTNFLKEVENFVSLIEAPRLSLSSEAAQERKNGHHEPLIIKTYSRSVEDKECGTRLSSYRFEDTDNDEQFTFFEASFDDCEFREKESIAAANSLQRLVESADQEQNCSREKSLDAEEAVAALPVLDSDLDSVRTVTEDLIPFQNSDSVPDVLAESTKTPEKATPTETLLISEDPGIESKPKGKADAARPALTDIDPNVIPMTKKSPTVNKSPLKMRAPKGFRRGFSRSLDSRDGSVTKVDFNIFRNGPTTQVVPRLPTKTSESPVHNAEASSIEAKITDVDVLVHVSHTSSPDRKLEDAGCEQELG